MIARRCGLQLATAWGSRADSAYCGKALKVAAVKEPAVMRLL